MNEDYVFPRSRDPEYQQWLVENYPTRWQLTRMRRKGGELKGKPKFSVVVPTDPKSRFLAETIASIRAQTYERWELLQPDSLHAGIVEAKGDWIAFVIPGDLLAPHALFEIAKLTRDADVIYGDEDEVDDEGLLGAPLFKPDWSPDSFLSGMYAVRFNFFRTALVRRIGGFHTAADLALRVTEATHRIRHVPDVLFHARIPKTSNYEAERSAIADALSRRGEGGRVEELAGAPEFHSVRYPIRRPARVDIIIPSRDQGPVVDRCLTSIFEKTHSDFVVTLVDNGTKEADALAVLEKWSRLEPKRFRVLPLDIPFNFSTLNNTAVERTSGEYILFLNNDTEILTPEWLDAMVEYAQRPSIGAVGCLQLYPDGTIQHAGVVVGLGGMAAHSHRALPGDIRGYMGRVITINNYAGVSGSCLMTRREVFRKYGPLDPQLPNDYQDVHYCLKLVDAGLHNVYLPHVKLVHHESKSRGNYRERYAKAQTAARKLMVKRWKKLIDHDPCYSPHLTRAGEDYRIRLHGDHRREGLSHRILVLQRSVQLAWRRR